MERYHRKITFQMSTTQSALVQLDNKCCANVTSTDKLGTKIKHPIQENRLQEIRTWFLCTARLSSGAATGNERERRTVSKFKRAADGGRSMSVRGERAESTERPAGDRWPSLQRVRLPGESVDPPGSCWGHTGALRTHSATPII